MLASCVALSALCCCCCSAKRAPQGDELSLTPEQVNRVPIEPFTAEERNLREESARAREKALGIERQFEIDEEEEAERRAELVRDNFHTDGPVLLLGSSVPPCATFPSVAPATLFQSDAPSLGPRRREFVPGLHSLDPSE